MAKDGFRLTPEERAALEAWADELQRLQRAGQAEWNRRVVRAAAKQEEWNAPPVSAEVERFCRAMGRELARKRP